MRSVNRVYFHIFERVEAEAFFTEMQNKGYNVRFENEYDGYRISYS